MTRFVRCLAASAPALLVATLGVVAPAYAGPIIASSHFDTNDEDWTVFGNSTPVVWESATGNPGGSISVTDDNRGGRFFFVAPQKFLDAAQSPIAYGGSLTFELMQTHLNGGTVSSDIDVKLIGNGITLGYSFNSPPSLTGFTHYGVALDTGTAWQVEGGGTATAVQIQSVLANLTGLQIRGEYWTGKDKGYLDNVEMRAVPEPSSLALAGLGVIPLGIGWVRRRSRRVVKAGV